MAEYGSPWKEFWNTISSLSWHFPVVKLLDFRNDWPALKSSTNPFVVVVMAHMKALETAAKDEARYRWKLNLVKGLYQRDYQRKDILELFCFIDWIMEVPENLENRFLEELS